jgi:ankyrin repeat protein
MGEGPWNLFDAALRGDLAVIREAIRAGADIDVRDDTSGGRRVSLDEWRARAEEYEDGVGPVRINEWVRFGRTPLLHAASAGRVEVVRELIAAGADVNARDALGYTALTLTLIPDDGIPASWRSSGELPGDDEACALALIAAGADVDAASFRGETALILAAGRGLVGVALALIAAGAGLDGRDAEGYTAFEAALARGHTAAARALIAAGADPRTEPGVGLSSLVHRSALMEACCDADPELVRLLLRAGEGLHDRSDDGSTPLHFAAGGDAVEVFSRKSEDGFRPRLMCPDSTGGSAEVVRVLIEAGAEVDARDESGKTPLMRAVRRGHLAVVEALIAAGADVDARIAPRALSALEEDILRMTRDLHETQPGWTDRPPPSADPQEFIGVGATPLILACKWNTGDARHYDPFLFDRTGIIRAMIAAGADVRARERDGSTALSHAIETRDVILSRDPTRWPTIPRALLEAALPKADDVISILRDAGAED